MRVGSSVVGGGGSKSSVGVGRKVGGGSISKWPSQLLHRIVFGVCWVEMGVVGGGKKGLATEYVDGNLELRGRQSTQPSNQPRKGNTSPALKKASPALGSPCEVNSTQHTARPPTARDPLQPPWERFQMPSNVERRRQHVRAVDGNVCKVSSEAHLLGNHYRW